mgnify:CR=1 FL=1
MKKEPLFIAFSTQKGGAGKTTLTVLMASYLYYVKGYDVAVVDCDYPQWSIHAQRERELEAVGYNDYYKLLMVRQFKATGRRIWPVVRCMPTEALREVDRILQGGYRPRIVFYDQPGTVNAEGVIASLASKFYQKAFLSFLIS